MFDLQTIAEALFWVVLVALVLDVGVRIRDRFSGGHHA
jgi:hypothetical protein